MKKLNCFLLALLFALSAFALTACGGKKGESDGGETEIEINYWKAGLGDEFFKKIVEEFKKEYPSYTVKVNYKEDFSDFNTKISLGAKYNTVDLYFGPAPEADYYGYLEPLGSVLSGVNGGESKRIGDKIDGYLLDTVKYSDGNYYILPYGGGICGIVYNNELLQPVLNKNGMHIPNTTDELRDAVLAIQSEYGTEHKPFIHFRGGYWEYVQDVWQAQYDGLSGYEEFYRLGSPASAIGTASETPDKNILLREDGRLEVLKVFEKILSSSFVVSGSNSNTHTEAQTKFLAGQAVMMVNGAWLVNEMRNVGSARYTDFRVMKTPVISSIINKCPSIAEDEELSALVSAIDAGSTALSGSGYDVTSDDYNRVKEARNLIWQVFSEHGACIPNYSTAKDGAKKFLEFYYSDKAQKIFGDTVHIALPFTYDNPSNAPDTLGWNNFEKDMYNYANSLTMLGVSSGKRSVLFTLGHLVNFPPIENNTFIVSVMSRASDPGNASYVWGEMKKLYEKNWSTYLSNARLG